MKKLIQLSTATAFSFLALYRFFLNFDQKLDPQILPWRIENYGLKSSVLQSQFYIFFLIFLGIVAITLATSKDKNESKVGLTIYYSNTAKIKLGFLAVLTGIYFLGQYDKWFRDGFLIAGFTLIALKKLKFSHLIIEKIYKNLILILFFSFFVGFVLMPFFITPIYEQDGYYASSSQHYASVLLPGFNFQAGNEVGSVGYGVSTTLLVASATKFLNFFDINNDYLLFLVVRIYQLIAIVLIFTIFWLINKKNAFLTASFTVLITAHYNTFGFTNYFPNLSGLRFINFLIGLIFLILLARRTKPNMVTYSMISSLLIFMGIETGAPVAVGLLVLYLMQAKPAYCKRYQLLLNAIYFSISVFLFFGFLFFTAKSLNLDLIPAPSAFSQNSSFNGAVGKVNVRATFALLISVVVLLRSFQLLNGSKTSKTINLQGSVASVVLVYLYVYFTRMNEEYLIFTPIPIIMMLSPYCGKNIIKLLRGRNKVISLMACVAISFFGGLATSNSYDLYRDFINNYKPFLKSDCTFTIKIDQRICAIHDKLTEMSDYFREVRLLGNSDQAVFLSRFPTEVKLYGLNKDFPYNSLVFEIVTNVNREDLLKRLRLNQIQYIFVDRQKPDSEPSVAFFHGLINDSNSFELESTSNYWEKYRRVEPSG